jgi:hypothetical protein
MPFRGETGGIGVGQGMGEVPAPDRPGGTHDSSSEPGPDDTAVAERHAHLAVGSRRSIPLDPAMQRRLDEARREAAEHAAHEEATGQAPRRAPRPERLQR